MKENQGELTDESMLITENLGLLDLVGGADGQHRHALGIECHRQNIRGL